ncbi:MAG: hypothetical protein A3K18_06500 [Lentisphaerae bacterium RIFOXYA12_64_32]|nr:MAG: hypothetical protein A3K18_06500 [Lentisphaerae bacterium RIFOXYA12_64_32]
MLYHAILGDARAISSQSLATPLSPADWKRNLSSRRRQWRQMLGIDPLPERTPMDATVTGMLDRADYVVEKIHFQSMPGAYVPGNLYRPAKIREPLPAVLYLCGHTKGKINRPYQANPRWFGQHGYVALVLDPIQLGESQGYHAGTISKQWYHWYSRGYTPAGVEIWNAMRALDYLQSRADVDGSRLGVTGLSGGGAMSWFLAAADERVGCCVPVCQTGSIEQHAVDRTVDGHCDCAFWINLHRWCTPDVGALIAPRPLLVASGTEDVIWRPFAFRDVMLRIRKQYRELGVEENCALTEDITPHGYSPALRNAIFSWFNRHLKNDSAPVTDDITDDLEPEENLLVFDGKQPAHDRMKIIDQVFIPRPSPSAPGTEPEIRSWQKETLAKLRHVTFPRTVPAAPPRVCEVRDAGSDGNLTERTWVFETSDGVELRAHLLLPCTAKPDAPLVVAFRSPDDQRIFFSRPPLAGGIHALTVDVRSTGATAMGPGILNTARRLYMNNGQTLPERQVHDLLAALTLVRPRFPESPLVVFGSGVMAPHAVYAALLNPDIGEIILQNPPPTHDDPAVAEFLAVLQTGDLPHNLALAFPRPITFVGEVPAAYDVVTTVYRNGGKGPCVRTVGKLADWAPAGPEPPR